MSRIHEAFRMKRSIERGEPQPTALHKLAAEHEENLRRAAEDRPMTVNEAIAELNTYAEIGYGDKPLYWLNLNIQENVEVEEISPLPDGEGLAVR